MKRLPFLSNADRRALLLLEWLLMFGLVGFCVYTWKEPRPEEQNEQQKEIPGTAPRKQKTAKQQTYTYAVPEEPVETFPFDPNTADSTTLLRLGLAPWQVQAIYKYRAKHGQYHTPEDFQRLPGMTVGLWKRLGPMVRIAEEFRYLRPEAKASRPVAPAPEAAPSVAAEPVKERDTIKYPVKYEEGTVVDINAADTNALKKIPGIASYRARKIVEYREKLGRFRHVEQVMEACELPDDVLSWMEARPVELQRLNVNKLSLQKLMRHPYISFYMARSIVEYRHQHGPLKGLSDLSGLEHFTPEKMEKLQDYLEF